MNSLDGYQGVDSYWYDQVPSYWKKTKNKYVFCQDKHVVGEDWEKFTLLTMGKSGVKPRDMDGGGKFPASFETYQTVEPNQLIFCLFDLDETPRTIGMSKDYGMITSAYDVFSTTEGNDPQFWTYFYQMIDDHKGLRPFYTGLRKVVRSETFMGIEVFSPPLEEQKLISRYLDKKTEQIDRLVERIQKKIELLKEQRTSLINQCVTKGLDPNVEMKDSGVEWVGEIPKHWDITKLKYLCPEGVQYGLNIESDSYKEIGVRFLRITDINSDGTLKSSGGVFLPEENVPREYLLNKNDILFSRSGGTVGKSTRISSTDHRMSFAGYLVRFSFQDEEISRFVKWVSESGIYWSWINLQIIQSTIQNVNGEKYANFSFSVPSHSEISKINDFLDEKTLKVDETINKHERKIHLLSEYRQTLISSAVTGKIQITESMI